MPQLATMSLIPSFSRFARNYNTYKCVITIIFWVTTLVEEKIGNCTLNKLIAMLENGWKIKSMLYRGFKDTMPCWTTDSQNPIVCLATVWFRFHKNAMPLYIGDKDYRSGFNEVIFEKP